MLAVYQKVEEEVKAEKRRKSSSLKNFNMEKEEMIPLTVSSENSLSDNIEDGSSSGNRSKSGMKK